MASKRNFIDFTLLAGCNTGIIADLSSKYGMPASILEYVDNVSAVGRAPKPFLMLAPDAALHSSWREVE